MTGLKKFALAAAVMAAGTGTMVGCSKKVESQGKQEVTFVHELVDSVASAVRENVAAARAVTADVPDTTPVTVAVEGGSRTGDLVLLNDRVYAVTDGVLVAYDFAGKTHERIQSPESLNAVAVHEGTVYAGGAHLYKLAGMALEPVEQEFDSEIRSLYSYEYRLMVGTRCNLYSTSIFGKELLLEDVSVSAMAADESGLWVGTDGQGLYRWDQVDFKRRFLSRDTALFDTVLALDYNHAHVYMGTTNGLHVYDGGRWTTFTTEKGMPSNRVTAVDASNWLVLAATDAGVVTYFEGEVTPVEKLENLRVTALQGCKRGIVAATERDGLVLKTSSRVQTLAPPDAQTSEQELTAAF